MWSLPENCNLITLLQARSHRRHLGQNPSNFVVPRKFLLNI